MMGIRIESIVVNGLGPISSLQWQFKDINLIYGKNEKGKTFLVEYILRSLFKQTPKTRDLTDSGQVVVSGIGKSMTTFNPKSREKLEDIVFDESDGIQVNLARLCVVKAGELSFSPNQDGTITKSILKEYLSDQHILDIILEKIPATIQESTWENGDIIGKRQAGPIKDLSEKLRSLSKIDELLQAIDANYSQGVIKKANVEFDDINNSIILQYRARRVYANELATLINQRLVDLKTIPEDSLDEVKLALSKVESRKINVEKIQTEIDDLAPKCENYQWLKTAIEECEKRSEGIKINIKPIFLIFSILGIVLAVVSAFLKYPIITLGLGLVSILFIYLLIKQFQIGIQGDVTRKEVEEIFREFETKFGIKTRSIVTLKSSFDTISPIFFKLQTLQTQLKENKDELFDEEKLLDKGLGFLDEKKVGSEDPNRVIARIQDRRNKLLQELESLKMKLATTQVQPEDYLEEEVGVKFDPDGLINLENSKQQLVKIIEDEKSTLDTLKQRVCDTTSDLISIGWDDLIENLRLKRNELSEVIKKLRAQIGAGIILTKVITDLREQEDETIVNALNSKKISEPIEAITHVYTGIELDGEELIVFNSLQRFPISKMSTGAQEQVLLALRIGLASHVLGDQKLFLILDDAFQHSDWDRREWLIDEMAALANRGWQIIYFSMDDNIKNLFETRIKPQFNGRYGYFELKS